MRVLELILALAAAPLLVASGYLCLLALVSRRGNALLGARINPRFDIVVPAHDEEQNIAGTVRSLLAIDYPRDRFRVLVVADNCADQTAARARSAGAEVLERTDPERRGKGYALAFGFAESLAGSAGAVVVVDADTVVSPNLLRAFAARLEQGAAAVQADYGVRNPDASWRTRLMTIALAMFHILRSLGRARLRVSCGLRGNGMCFTHAVLREVPHEAFSLVEDLEYGIRLGEAGHRVHYAAEAHVLGEMVAAGSGAATQRTRWERGRMQMARLHGPRLLRLTLARRDRVLLDLALDVLVPPLSILAGSALLGLSCAVALSIYRQSVGPALYAWSAAALGLFVYLLRGWQLSGTGARGLADLLFAPAYLGWRLALALRRTGRRGDEWVRTKRENEAR